MQRRHQDLQVILLSEVDERVLCNCDHVLVDQIQEEPVADGELKDTLEEVNESNLGRGWVHMLVAASWCYQESNVVSHIQVIRILHGDSKCILIDIEE